MNEAVALRSLGEAGQVAFCEVELYNINMYYVYILKNSETGEFYTGFSEDLKTRLKSHREKTVKTTKGKGEYKLIWYCAFKAKSQALDFERYLKHGSGHAFMHKRLV